MDHWNEKMFPWDRVTPRFYPPGKHPAIKQWYSSLRLGEKHLADWPSGTGSPESRLALEKYLAYARQQIADFEGHESELKAEAFLRE